jgi:hypothetical protein
MKGLLLIIALIIASVAPALAKGHTGDDPYWRPCNNSSPWEIDHCD